MRAKKSLGQHFLTDPKTLERIVRAAELKPGDEVLEIGPGTGNLTKRLLDAGCHVTAIEKDEALARALPHHPHLEVLEQDALDFSFDKLNGARRKVVANLPYNIATELIVRLLPLHEQFSTLVLMIQWEVAKRFFAKPSTYERGSLSVYRELYADGKILFPVQPGCFAPPPKVKSAVIQLRLKPTTAHADFSPFVQEGFKTRRKTLKRTLASHYGAESVEKALIAAGLKPTARAQELSLEEWLALFALLSDEVAKDKRQEKKSRTS